MRGFNIADRLQAVGDTTQKADRHMAKDQDIDIVLDDIDSEWETSSGLPLANLDVEVTDCTFGFNAKLGPDVLCAIFTFVPVDGDGESIEQSFSVGKGWEAKSKGAYIAREDGRGGQVNKQTNFGRLIDSAVAAVKEAGVDIPFKSPRIAAGWVGTKWHMATETIETENPQTGKKSTKDAFVFGSYLGRGDGPVAAGAKVAGKSKDKGEVAAADDPNAELRAKLIELAKECDDPDDFVEKALAIPGVEDGPLEAAVLKHKKPDSIWQQAKGGE
jgi:hypothetical protein